MGDNAVGEAARPLPRALLPDTGAMLQLAGGVPRRMRRLAGCDAMAMSSPSQDSVMRRVIHDLLRTRMPTSLTLALIAASCVPSSLRAQATPALLGMVGDWRDSVAAIPMMVVNGARCRGTSDVDSLRERSLRAFTRVDSTLLAQWATAEAFPVAMAVTPKTFADGRVRVSFNMLGGRSDQNAGIIFGLQPSGEYHYVRYNTKDCNIALWHFTGGKRQRVLDGTAHRLLPLQSWHELVLTVRGATIHAAITGDTTLAVTHTFDAPRTGKVGLWVKRDAVTAFRGFSVEAR